MNTKNNKTETTSPTKKLTKTERSALIDHKIECVEESRKSGYSLRAFVSSYAPRQKRRVTVGSLFRWDKAYDGTRASLARKAHAPKSEKDHLKFVLNRANQWDYIIGHLSSIGSGLKKAHESLAEVCESLGWGQPMTLAAAYHKHKGLGFYRPALLKDKEKHYATYAAFAKSRRILANEIWMIDEFQFAVDGLGNAQTIFYGAVCVDRLTQLVRYVELSLHSINKTSFLRAIKGALLANPAIGTNLPAKPKTIRCDNAGWHEPKESDDAYMDFRQAAEELGIMVHWNDKHCPQQDCMVENWIGHFKRDFVNEFRFFIEKVAPAETPEDWVFYQNNLPTFLAGYCFKWNTSPQSDGTSRIDKFTKYAVDGSFAITPAEIDAAVRISIDRKMQKYGIAIGEVYYHSSKLLLKVGDKAKIRVRPEGAGADVEAYVNDKPIGTLRRVDDDHLLSEKLNASYKKERKEALKADAETRKRFVKYAEQVALSEHPEGSEMHTRLLRLIERKNAGLDEVVAAQSPDSTETFDSEIV